MPTLDGSTTDVVMLARLGCAPPDQAAWEAFVDRYGPKIRAWCRAWHLQEADAQDVTQAVLIQLVVHQRRFACAPPRSFRGWLKTSVMHVCSHNSIARRRSLIGLAQHGSDGLNLIDTVAAREDLGRRLEAEFDLELLEEAERRVRSRVAPHTWEAYRLTAVEGLSGAETAVRLGMKATAVFVARSRVTEQLQREIKALENAPDSAQPP